MDVGEVHAGVSVRYQDTKDALTICKKGEQKGSNTLVLYSGLLLYSGPILWSAHILWSATNLHMA